MANDDLGLSSVMVVGVNTRPIVKSAKLLGLRTVAVDSFDDVDLAANADILISKRSSQCHFNRERSDLLRLSMDALEINDVDAILLASGTEHHPEFVKKLGKKVEVIGNKPPALGICRDKGKLFRIAARLGIPLPKTKRIRGLNRALKSAEDIGYPVVLKPAFGGGGIGIKLARTPGELRRFYRAVLNVGDGKSLYVQEYIRGVDASASILSSGDEARCLTVNEQIIGDKRLGAPRTFGYCGNIIPLNAGRKAMAKIAEYSEALCGEIRLVGSNGVDFVLAGDEPHLMEINPRFQSTIDCVEGLLGINLVGEHIRACRGELGKYRKPKGYSAKLILYAKGNVKIPDFTKFPDIVDIPRKGSTIGGGKPICSVLKFGYSRQKTITDARATAKKIYRWLAERINLMCEPNSVLRAHGGGRV